MQTCPYCKQALSLRIDDIKADWAFLDCKNCHETIVITHSKNKTQQLDSVVSRADALKNSENHFQTALIEGGPPTFRYSPSVLSPVLSPVLSLGSTALEDALMTIQKVENEKNIATPIALEIKAQRFKDLQKVETAEPVVEGTSQLVQVAEHYSGPELFNQELIAKEFSTDPVSRGTLSGQTQANPVALGTHASHNTQVAQDISVNRVWSKQVLVGLCAALVVFAVGLPFFETSVRSFIETQVSSRFHVQQRVSETVTQTSPNDDSSSEALLDRSEQQEPSTPTSGAAVQKLYVVAPKAIIRQGPGTQFDKAMAVTKGREVHFIDERNGWLQVQLQEIGSKDTDSLQNNVAQNPVAQKFMGWIRKDLVSFSALATGTNVTPSRDRVKDGKNE